MKAGKDICALGQGHYSVAIMRAMASQITSLTTVYSTVYSGADQVIGFLSYKFLFRILL